MMSPTHSQFPRECRNPDTAAPVSPGTGTVRMLSHKGTRTPRLTAEECLQSAQEWDTRARQAKTDHERRTAEDMADAFRKVADSLEAAKR